MQKLRRAIGRVNPIPWGKIKIRGDHSATDRKVLYCSCGWNPSIIGWKQTWKYNSLFLFLLQDI